MANTREQPVAVNRLGIDRVRVNRQSEKDIQTEEKECVCVCVKLTVLDHQSGTAIKSTKSRLITQQLFKKVTIVLESNVGITYKLQVNTNLGMH